MRIILTNTQAKQLDQAIIQGKLKTSLNLMEEAGHKVAREILSLRKEEKVLFLCGMGNNGADGLVAARCLLEEKVEVRLLLIGDNAHCSAEWQVQMRRLMETRGFRDSMVLYFSGEMLETAQGEDLLKKEMKGNLLLVDGLCGIGLKGPVKPYLTGVLGQVSASPAKVKLAIDVPSGIRDGYTAGEPFFPATHTITFGYGKRCLYDPLTRNACGRIHTVSIGYPAKLAAQVNPTYWSHTWEDLEAYPRRQPQSHKYSYGRILVAGGSLGMAGAPCFAGMGAYRTGVGLVDLVVEEGSRPVVQTLLPEAIVHTWESFSEEGAAKACLEKASLVILGPGLGLKEESRIFFYQLWNTLKKMPRPLLLDGDALTLLSEDKAMQKAMQTYPAPLIYTPHAGELSRMLGVKKEEIHFHFEKYVLKAAGEFPGVLVGKNTHTLIPHTRFTLPDGTEEEGIYIGLKGTTALATGGSGDILTGIIGALTVLGLPPASAATLGVYIHGMAGEEAAKTTGEAPAMARDILDGLGKVMRAAER